MWMLTKEQREWGRRELLFIAAKHTSRPRQRTPAVLLCYFHLTLYPKHMQWNPAVCHTCTCDCVTGITAGKVYSLHIPIPFSLLDKLGSPWPGVCCVGQLIITANSNWSHMTDSMAIRDRGWLQHWGTCTCKFILFLVTYTPHILSHRKPFTRWQTIGI